ADTVRSRNVGGCHQGRHIKFQTTSQHGAGNASLYDDARLMSLTNEQANKYTSFIRSNTAFFQASGKKLSENGAGRFFAIGSVAGQPGYMNPDRTVYSFYKATLRPMIEVFNLETPPLVKGIYINLGKMQQETDSAEVVTIEEVADKIFHLSRQKEDRRSMIDIMGKKDRYFSRFSQS
ncbi:MAG: hypothetical protein AAGE99_05485, partial [Chlamydiota bacterium]